MSDATSNKDRFDAGHAAAAKREKLLGTMLERAEAKGYAQAIKDVVEVLREIQAENELSAVASRGIRYASHRIESRFPATRNREEEG